LRLCAGAFSLLAKCEGEGHIRFSLTELAAWWGAIIATCLLAWEIYKHTSATRSISVELQPQGKAICVRAANHGHGTVTIRSLGVKYYPGIWALIRNQCTREGVIAKPSITHPLPYQLAPGDTWLGLIEQDEDMCTMAANAYLMCDLFLADRARPIRRRIRPGRPSEQPEQN